MTHEDKKWFIDMEARLDDKIERAVVRLDAKIERVDAKFERTRTEFSENLERVETTLLAEFHKWASPLDARMRTHTALLRAIDLESEAMDERITKLEGRHN